MKFIDPVVRRAAPPPRDTGEAATCSCLPSISKKRTRVDPENDENEDAPTPPRLKRQNAGVGLAGKAAEFEEAASKLGRDAEEEAREVRSTANVLVEAIKQLGMLAKELKDCITSVTAETPRPQSWSAPGSAAPSEAATSKA
jgi:hypothetical protein